jgi:transposase-like protein
MEVPKTLTAAIAFYSNPDNAFRAAVELRWPGGKVACPRCNEAKHSFIKTRRIWFCYICKKQFTVKVGTIFEDSPLGLDKWMTAVWLIANCKNGISSYELAKDLGIRQNSAWFMLHRIREAMKGNSSFKLGGGSEGGPVEMDETFVGGKVKNMHKSKIKRVFHGKGTQGGHGKAVVMGMLERGGQVRARVIERRIKEHVYPVIDANIQEGSHVITDEANVYIHLHREYFHEVINHVEGYVREHIHTNGIENFWALLKRGLNGTYVSVEPFHLDAYVTEQVFRFNNRATKDNPLDDADRFALVMSQVGGKRLTYKQLTGKMDDPFLQQAETGTGPEVPF